MRNCEPCMFLLFSVSHSFISLTIKSADPNQIWYSPMFRAPLGLIPLFQHRISPWFPPCWEDICFLWGSLEVLKTGIGRWRAKGCRWVRPSYRFGFPFVKRSNNSWRPCSVWGSRKSLGLTTRRGQRQYTAPLASKLSEMRFLSTTSSKPEDMRQSWFGLSQSKDGGQPNLLWIL